MTSRPTAHTGPLPLLYEPCPDDPTDADRKANAALWEAWHQREIEAFERFLAPYPPGSRFLAHERWLDSAERHALKQDTPEELPDVGCVECDGRGVVPTEAGEQVLDLLAVMGRK